MRSSRSWLGFRPQGELDRVKLIYTIPEHANPTGISLAPERREPLLDVVRRWSRTANRRILVLEDAAYHGLSLRRPGTEEPLEPGPGRRRRDGDPGPHVQQNLQSRSQDRLRRFTQRAR